MDARARVAKLEHELAMVKRYRDYYWRQMTFYRDCWLLLEKKTGERITETDLAELGYVDKAEGG